MREYRCEGIGSVNGGIYDSLHVDGIFTAKGPIKANQVSGEGVLKVGAISVSGDLYFDGVVNTTILRADNATLLRNKKRELLRPFTKIRALFSVRDLPEEKNARIRDIEANKLHIEDYSVQKITGKDIVIGKGCVVDKVIATTSLKIHKTAQVKDFIGSVMPEYVG